ncbi:MAG: DUF5050 domain-containing protein, partial [Eubacteriales bacterium]|nr:DUF5050 domain-containing protein [Eubacteriales bacterium]
DSKNEDTDAKKEDAGSDSKNSGTAAELPTEKDAIAYTKGILDLICTGTYDTSSVNFSDVDEENTEDMQNQIIDVWISMFESQYSLNDESKETIKATMVKALSKCRYSVDRAEKTGDGEYNVYVSIEPLRIIDGVEDRLVEYISNLDASELTGMSEEEQQIFVLQKTFELVAEGLDDPTYDPAEEVVVTYSVLDPEKNMYGLDEAEGQKLGEKLFSLNTGDTSSSTGAGSGSAVASSGVSSDDEGMLSGNFYNRGYFAFKGDVCYFSNESKLYRSDASLKDPVLLADGFGNAFINIAGNHIYHLVTYKKAIFRCDLDGTNDIIVFDGAKDPDYAPASLYIHGGWCYFSNEKNLYRISLERLDNTDAGAAEEAECIATDFNYTSQVYPTLCIIGEKLYYNGKGGLTCIAPDGSDRKVISDQNGSLISDGTSIFTHYGTRWIRRIDQDGTFTELLELQSSEGSIRNINYADGWIYYVLETDSAYELWKIKPDGTARTSVNEICSLDHHVISMNTFPGKNYAYFYLLKDENDGLTPISKCVALK